MKYFRQLGAILQLSIGVSVILAIAVLSLWRLLA